MKTKTSLVAGCFALCCMMACSENENESGNGGNVDFGSGAITNSGYGKYPHGYDGTLTKTTEDGKIAGLPNDLSDRWGRGETDVWDGTVDVSWYTANPNMETFFIKSAEQLAGLSVLRNEDFKGKRIILNVNVILNEQIKTDKDYNVLNADELKQWSPILDFEGTFDGRGHIVSGLYIDQIADMVGLFGGSRNSDCCNLGIVNSYIKGNDYVAAISGGDLNNCFSTAIVIGENNVEGLGGDGVEQCFHKGVVIAKSGDAYGISGSTAKDCYNAGVVYAFGCNVMISYSNSSMNNYNLYKSQLGYSSMYHTLTSDGYNSYSIQCSMDGVTGTFEDNSGLLTFVDGVDESYTKYTTLVEALNGDRNLPVWTIDPERNNGYPIYVNDIYSDID